MMNNSTLVKVFLGIFLGIVAGAITGQDLEVLGIPMVKIYDLIGQLFLNALTLVVVPLVASSIITGTARLGLDKGFAVLGKRTFGYFILTGVLAVLVGMGVMLLAAPGKLIDTSLLSGQQGLPFISQLQISAEGGTFEKISGILFRIVPSNILAVASQGQMLGLIFFSILFGFFSTQIDSDLSELMVKFWKGLFQVMMKMTHLVMRALPFGVFGLMAKVVATTGFESMKPVAFFFGTVVSGLILYMLLILPLLLIFIGKVNPLTLLKNVGPALFTAFTTSSSAATLPVTIDCMEKRAGLPNRFCSFILPLGTSINLTGTALYASAAVIFIAQAYGVDFNLGNLFTITLMGLFTAFGMVAGIPSGSLITIVVILQSLGLPSEGIILILPVERILDMLRTVVSVWGNTCCTMLVAKSKLDVS